MQEDLEIREQVGGDDAQDCRQILAAATDERIGVSIGPYGMWVPWRDE